MSDLISRSELIKFFEEHMRTAEDFREIIINIIPTIKNQPTAYSVDKVVEEIKTLKEEALGEYNMGEYNLDNNIGNSISENYRKDMNEGKCFAYDEAIEIVKQGGASDDVCEWELKNACYTTSIKHYYSLPTSIVKTFNNCPYCGRKIKVVE